MNDHRTLRSAFAAILAVLMALAVFPVSALPAFEAEKSPAAPYWTVPEGYNEYDYNKCAAFLEQEDENGVKNGQKLNPDYDPNDPETWIADTFDLHEDYDKFYTYFEGGYFNYPSEDFPIYLLIYDTVTIGIDWLREDESEYTSDGLHHVHSIILPSVYHLYYAFDCENPYLSDEEDVSDWYYAGDMDFSGMERLSTFFVNEAYYETASTINLSDCESLTAVGCPGCTQIKELNITGDKYIRWLNCNGTCLENGLDISQIDIDEYSHFDLLNISCMGLTSFEFPNVGIDCLRIDYNQLETLDLSPLRYLYEFSLVSEIGFANGYEGLKQINYLGRNCRVEGSNGYIGAIDYKYDYFNDYDESCVYDCIRVGYGAPDFIGWFDGNGELITEDENLYFDEGAIGEFIAKFGSISDPGIGDTDGSVPEGYNANDYNKLAAFFEQTNLTGRKNGARINADYDVNDPETWSGIEWIEVNGELRVSVISISDKCMEGELDVSDCEYLNTLYCHYGYLTELNASGCIRLEVLHCFDNRLTKLDVSGCENLTNLICCYNDLRELDVSECTSLSTLSCEYNSLSELDVSVCTNLTNLSCEYNSITELDLSNNQQLPYDYILAEGNGYIGYRWYYGYRDLYAMPDAEAVFEGFYNEEGVLLSAGTPEWNTYVYSIPSDAAGTIIARFSGASIPGDTDGDGEVSASDALLLLRFCVGELTEDQIIEAADVNGDGAIDLLDALLTLRIALGEV